MSKREIPRPDMEALWEHYGGRVIGPERGGWRKATCVLPGHEDRNPSASVNTEAGKWKCWACAEHGDAIDLIGLVDELDFSGAVDVAAGLAGDSSGGVPEPTRRPSGLLPQAQGGRRGGGNFVPPWKRL